MKYLRIIFLLISITTAHAASFDCNQAKTNIEKMICENKELSKLDEQASHLYEKAIAIDPRLTQVQKKWMDERALCATVICVQNIYIRRSNELNRFIVLHDYKSNKTTHASENVDIESNISAEEKTKEADTHKGSNDKVYVYNEVSASTKELNIEDFESIIITTLSFAVVVGAIYAWFGYRSHCPKCRKWYSQETLGRDFAEKWSDFKTFEVSDTHKDAGHHTAKSVHKEKYIQATYYKYWVRKRCKKCHHEWSEALIETV